MCSRVLPLFGKLPQWNHHANCHVNKTTFQSRLRFQTGLSSLSVSCKRTLSFRNCSKRFYHILKRKFNWKIFEWFFSEFSKKNQQEEKWDLNLFSRLPCLKKFLKTFLAAVSILYPLKTLENHQIFYVFKGCEREHWPEMS